MNLSLWKTKIFSPLFFQAAGSQTDLEHPNTPQFLPRSLINSWELEESQGAQGGYPAHLLLPSSTSSSSSASDSHSLLSDILSKRGDPGLPSLLFLTHRHLWVLKMDFRELAERERRSADLHHSSSSWCRLVRVPLGSMVLHPRERASQVGDRTSYTSCLDPKHHHRYRGCDWTLWMVAFICVYFCQTDNGHIVFRNCSCSTLNENNNVAFFEENSSALCNIGVNLI